MRPLTAALFAMLAAPLAVSGCSRSGEDGGVEAKIVPQEALSPAQARQAARAKEARDALFQKLVAELTASLGAGGPAAAISVCKDRAPAIAEEVSEKMGVRIARTSFKLRNPRNAPPAWAAGLVEKRVAEPAHVALADGSLGVLFPIVTAAPCLRCHGEAEALAPETSAALASAYPDDQATGFREGDLRGWFWIEAPALP